MPLQDHFHPPLSLRRHWHAFHNAWAMYLAADLNRRMPEGYFAEANVQFGIEIDVAALEGAGATLPAGDFSASGPEELWTPPAPVQTIPLAIVTDAVEVQVFDGREGPTLVGVIELVSPANKDRAAHRDAFVAKCETYLSQAIRLVVVDIVTGRFANLHKELLARLGGVVTSAQEEGLYTAPYRPVKRDEQISLDIWHETLVLGQPLPTLPLWLRGGPCLPVALEATYERACQEQRVTADGA